MKFQLRTAQNGLREEREKNALVLGILGSSQNQGWSSLDLEPVGAGERREVLREKNGAGP